MLLKNRCLFTLGLIMAIVFILLFVANSHQVFAGNATVKPPENVRMLAEQGDANAQINLGFMYYEGKGVPKNYIRAYAWCNLAASQGDDSFAKFRDAFAKSYMTNQQIASAQELSVELQNKIKNRFKTTTSDTKK